MSLLDYLRQHTTPEEYNETVYRLCGYTEAEIKELPPDADEWLGHSEDVGRAGV